MEGASLFKEEDVGHDETPFDVNRRQLQTMQSYEHFKMVTPAAKKSTADEDLTHRQLLYEAAPINQP